MLTVDENMHQELRETGLIGPFELRDPSILGELAGSLPNNLKPRKNRHADIPLVARLFEDASLRASVKEFFGDQLLLWRSSIILKNQSSSETRWHHDRHFERGDENINLEDLSNHFSFLIAVTDIGENQGLIEYIAGSHLPLPGIVRDLTPYHLKPKEDHFLPSPVEEFGRLKQLPLRAGQFALFHSALVHHSKPFIEGSRRVAIAGRLVRKGTDIPEHHALPKHIVTFN